MVTHPTHDPPLPRRCVGYAEARALHGPVIDRIAALYRLGDPGHRVDPDPDWLDPVRADRGGEVLRRHGLLGAVVLRCYALPLSYRSPGGIRPLIHTGALVQSAAARLYRTAEMVLEAQQPGAMHPGGPAWATAGRVRELHEHVRRSLRQSGWDDADGAPIPQPDLAATALLFGPMLVEGLRTMGARISTTDADAVAHLVRAMAHGQGVLPELQVDTHADALVLFEQLTAMDGPADADGASLMAALLDVPLALARGRRARVRAVVLRRLLEDIAVTTLGRDDARALGLTTRGRLARPIQWVARTQLLHHPRLVPVHDEMMRRLMAHGGARLVDPAPVGSRNR